MKYTIERVKLDKHHPLWPDQYVYKLWNIITRRYNLGCYTTFERANFFLQKLNS